MEVWKGSYTVEAWTIMLIRCLVLSTIMTPRTREEKFLHHVSVEMLPLRGLMYDSRNCLWEGWCITLGKVPLRGLLYEFRKSASERADVWFWKLLWEGCWRVCEAMPLIRTYTYNHRKISFERAADVREKQCLWLGLICTTIEKSPLRGLLSCMWNNASR